ncbi:Kelch repeat-containing protein [Spirosoma arboris]|nr:kelch repeat-containing protein [Spirosoma arboris]
MPHKCPYRRLSTRIKRTGIGLLMTYLSVLSASAQAQLRYTLLPDLPALTGQPNPGVAGAFAGASHDALLIAGGANFPNGFPWQGGTKVWHSTVYVLVREGNRYRWQATHQLDRPRAYGASVVWNEQLICVGGNDEKQRFADVFSLQWNPLTATLNQQSLPALPLPLANLAAAISGNSLYVFGGESDRGTETGLYVLDLKALTRGWQKLADLPGPARAYTAMTAQSDGTDQSLYVVGGRQTVNGVTTIYSDVYAYQINRKQWKRLPDMRQPLAAHQVIAFGSQSLVVFGGDDGKRLRQIEALTNQVKVLPEGVDKEKRTTERNNLQIDHPGFIKTVWQLRTDTKIWSVVDTLPFPSPVTTPLVRWGNSVIIPSGEITPGIRTPAIWKID